MIFLKYLLAATVCVDLVSALILLKNLNRKVTRYLLLGVCAMFTWKALFWFSIYTNTTPLTNSIVDRLSYFFGLLTYYFTLYFILEYTLFFNKINRLLLHLLNGFLVVALVSVALVGVGERTYVGPQTYQYALTRDFISSIALFFYDVVAVSIFIGIIFILIHLVQQSLSRLEKRRNRILATSLIISILFTFVPNIIVGFILDTLNQASLSSDWYTILLVLTSALASYWTVSTTYLVSRYQLFGIHIRFRRPILILVSVLISGIFFFLIDLFLVRTYTDHLFISVVSASLMILIALGLVWLTYYYSDGDPISLALLEQKNVDATCKQLADKIKDYLFQAHNVAFTSCYFYNPDTKNYVHCDTNQVIKLPVESLNKLQNGNIVNEPIPNDLKQTSVIIPLVYNKTLVGLVATEQIKVSDVAKLFQPYSALIYNAIAVASFANQNSEF